MSNIIHYTQCPVCLKTNIKPLFACVDHTVSKEEFYVWECSNCTLRFTQDVPDADSISKYYQSTDYVSHSDTKKGIINILYHQVRNFTLKSKLRLVERITGKHEGSLLDIGAGTGAFAHTMKQAGWHVSALEPDESARRNAATKYNLSLEDPARLYEFPANTFDALTMWHVLEHVHDLHRYLQTFHQVLKEDGRLIIAVPNYKSTDAKIYGKHWAAYDVPRHVYHFSPASMKILLDSEGFKLEQIKPMWFDSFYVSMLSEQYKSGSNLFMAAWNGFRSNIIASGDKKRCSSLIYIAKKKTTVA